MNCTNYDKALLKVLVVVLFLALISSSIALNKCKGSYEELTPIVIDLGDPLDTEPTSGGGWW